MSATFMMFFLPVPSVFYLHELKPKRGRPKLETITISTTNQRKIYTIPFQYFHSVHLPATHCSSTFSHSVDNRDPPFGPCDPEKSRGDFDFVEKQFVYAVYVVYGWVYD
jgi:hypothetical protein